MTGFVELQPLTKPEELEYLKARAAEDGHEVLFPTHLAIKDGEIVGYVSLGFLPTVNIWMSSKGVKVRDSLALLNIGQHMLRERKIKHFLMPCAKNSPYYPFMEKLGFKCFGESTLQVKV